MPPSTTPEIRPKHGAFFVCSPAGVEPAVRVSPSLEHRVPGGRDVQRGGTTRPCVYQFRHGEQKLDSSLEARPWKHTSVVGSVCNQESLWAISNTQTVSANRKPFSVPCFFLNDRPGAHPASKGESGVELDDEKRRAGQQPSIGQLECLLSGRVRRDFSILDCSAGFLPGIW